MSEDSLTASLDESSGTLVTQVDSPQLDHSSSSNGLSEAPHKGNEEEALDSLQVIELQSFSDRKVWIEEKIKASIKSFSSVAIKAHSYIAS